MNAPIRRILAVASLLAIGAAAPAVEFTKESVQAMLDRRAAAIKAEDVEKCLSFRHPDSYAAGGLAPDRVREIAAEQFRRIDFESISFAVEDITPAGDLALVRVREAARKVEGGVAKDETKHGVWILKAAADDACILMDFEDVDPASVDRATSTYVSKTGGFSMQYPEGWVPTRAGEPMASLLIDGVNVLAPDLGGSIFVGVVQLPMKMEAAAAAKMSAQADAAAMKRLATNYKPISEGEATLAGMPGWRVVSEFEIAGEHRKRSQQYFGNESLIYFIIGDIVGSPTPEAEAAIRGKMAATVDSFKLRPIEEGVSVAEQVRADNAQGTIQGNVYTNREMKCFIAAPEGWSMRTSANPGTLVEMQKGSSIIRLIAQCGIPAGMSGQKIFSDRIESVKPIVKDFRELSRGEIVLAGGPAWQSTQSYTLDGLGDFGVKETTLVRNGTYYLILCQAITPDKFSDMEKDFDKAFAGFGLLP